MPPNPPHSPEALLEKRQTWIDHVVRTWYLPEPWGPSGELDPPPSFLHSKRTWESLTAKWKIRRVRAYWAYWCGVPFDEEQERAEQSHNDHEAQNNHDEEGPWAMSFPEPSFYLEVNMPNNFVGTAIAVRAPRLHDRPVLHEPHDRERPSI